MEKIKTKKFLNYFFQSIFSNGWSYNIYYDKLKEITITLYKWLNLPPEIDERFLELSLFERGQIVFFEDDVVGFAVMNLGGISRFDIYRRPIIRRAYAANGAHANLNNKNSVIIYNNVLRTSSEDETLYFAEKLAFFEQVININMNAQKTPLFIRCSDKERLTLKNLFMKYEGGQPIIFGDKNISQVPISVINTEAPFVADKAYEMKTKYWNEFLTFKGISNVNINKKERLTTDEVQRQLGGSIAARGSGLLMRKEAAKQINKMFGLNIDVVFNEDVVLKILDAEDELVGENEIDEAGGDVNE